jgi:hypothetical protein
MMDGPEPVPGEGLWWKWTGRPEADGFLNDAYDATLMRLNLAGRRRCRWCAAAMGWRGSSFVCQSDIDPCDG